MSALTKALPLGDLIKQDIASDLNSETDRMSFKYKIIPYLVFTMVFLLIWLITLPAWNWFITEVLNAEKPDLVFEIIQQLVPCYAFFAFGNLLNGILYAIGKTSILALKSFIGNCVIVGMFLLFSNQIFFKTNVYSVASIFGIGLVLGSILTSIFSYFVVRKSKAL